jgi:hypothetical protein
VVAFLGKKPADKWTDEDLPMAEWRLAELAHRIADIERLRHAFQDKRRAGAEDFEAVLLRVVSRERGELDRLLYMTPARKVAIETSLGKVRSELGVIKDSDLQLLVLAELVGEILVAYQSASHTNRVKTAPTMP